MFKPKSGSQIDWDGVVPLNQLKMKADGPLMGLNRYSIWSATK